MPTQKTNLNIDRPAIGKLLIVVLVMSSLFCVACTKKIENLYSPDELVQLLKRYGWSPLPFPDSKVVPGSIVRVTEKNGVQFIDDLSSCGYRLSEFELKSTIPAIKFIKRVAYDADVLLNIKGITAGPSFSKASTVAFEISDHGADAFRILLLRVKMEDPEFRKSVKDFCMSYLLQPDTYLVTEAFRVSKGKYTLYDKNNAKLSLKTPEFGGLLKFEPNVNYEVTADGSLEISQPVYFAVRMAVRVGEGFMPLGPSETKPETADAKIEQIYLKSAIKK